MRSLWGRESDALFGETLPSRYAPLPLPMPDVPPKHPGHAEIRQVSRCGTFKLEGHQRFLSQSLAGETIAFEEVADGVWSLSFYAVELGRFDKRNYQIKT